MANLPEIFKTHTLWDHKWNLLVIEAIHIAGIFTLQIYLRIQGSLSSLYGTQRNWFPAAIYIYMFNLLTRLLGSPVVVVFVLPCLCFLNSTKGITVPLKTFSSIMGLRNLLTQIQAAGALLLLQKGIQYRKHPRCADMQNKMLHFFNVLSSIFLSPPTLLVLNSWSSPAPLQLELRDLLWIVSFSRSLTGQ